jgi:ribosome-associated protein
VRTLEALDLAHKIVEIGSDKQAANIVLLDARGVCSFADYFVLMSAENSRQMHAVLDEVSRTLKKEGVYAHHCEGEVDSGWLLMDYGPVVVHIFSPEEREFYEFDNLWGNAKTVVRIQ